MRLPLLALALFLAAIPMRANAQESSAKDLLRQGIALRRAQRNEDALAAFEAANRLEPSPCASAQIGLAQQALGRWPEAENNLVHALSHADDPWIRRERAALEGALVAISTQLGWLEVGADANDAEVVIDGHSSPVQAAPLRVTIGELSLTVRAPGRRAEGRTVTIHPGTRTRVEVALAALEPTPSVTASSPGEPSAVGTPPASAPPPAASSRTALLPGSPREAGVAARYTGPIVVGGAGVVALAAGTWLGFRALDARNTRDSLCTVRYCDKVGLASDHDARVDATASTVTFVVGASALALGATWFFLRKGARIQIAPTVGTTSGLVVGGAL